MQNGRNFIRIIYKTILFISIFTDWTLTQPPNEKVIEVGLGYKNAGLDEFMHFFNHLSRDWFQNSRNRARLEDNDGQLLEEESNTLCDHFWDSQVNYFARYIDKAVPQTGNRWTFIRLQSFKSPELANLYKQIDHELASVGIHELEKKDEDECLYDLAMIRAYSAFFIDAITKISNDMKAQKSLGLVDGVEWNAKMSEKAFAIHQRIRQQLDWIKVNSNSPEDEELMRKVDNILERQTDFTPQNFHAFAFKNDLKNILAIFYEDHLYSLWRDVDWIGEFEFLLQKQHIDWIKFMETQIRWGCIVSERGTAAFCLSNGIQLLEKLSQRIDLWLEGKWTGKSREEEQQQQGRKKRRRIGLKRKRKMADALNLLTHLNFNVNLVDF